MKSDIYFVIVLMFVISFMVTLFEKPIEHFITTEIKGRAKGISSFPVNISYDVIKDIKPIHDSAVKEIEFLRASLRKSGLKIGSGSTFPKFKRLIGRGASVSNTLTIESIDSKTRDLIISGIVSILNKNGESRKYARGEIILNKTTEISAGVREFVIDFILFESTRSLSVPLQINGTLEGNQISYKSINILLGSDDTSGIDASNYATNNLGVFKTQTTSEKILISQKEAEKELDKRRFKITEIAKGSCFRVPGHSSFTNIQECIDSGGIWDRPVKESNECPFYKKGKRGGNVNGYCEMPSGISRIGYRNYDPKHKPMCYCKTGDKDHDTECCDGVSDYRFPNTT